MVFFWKISIWSQIEPSVDVAQFYSKVYYLSILEIRGTKNKHYARLDICGFEFQSFAAVKKGTSLIS